MSDTVNVLIKLLKSAITEQQVQLPEINEKQIREMYDIAHRHDVSPLFCFGTNLNGLVQDSSLSAEFKKEIYTAAVRNEVILSETSKICRVLENEGIPYIPLKGSVIRNYYPQQWMRPSRDIDILVKKEDINRANEAVQTQLGFVHDTDGKNAIILKAPQGICFELHHTLIAENIFPQAAEVLDGVWDYSAPDEGFKRKMSDTFFIYYYIVHTAIHFSAGSGGLRPIFDLWLLKKNFSFDENELNRLLEKSGMLKFYRAIQELSAVWIDGAEHTAETRLIESYITTGGIDGERNLIVTIRVNNSKSKARYVLSMIFLPMDKLKKIYPVLEKAPILVPFCLVHRVFTFLFGNKKKSRKKIINELRNISGENMNDLLKIWNIVGFSDKK